MTRRLVGLGLVWLLLTGAAPLPLKPSLPDLVRLLPWVAAPLDKPPVTIGLFTLPPAPTELPPVPLVPIVVPLGVKPTAPLPATRALPCVGAWLGIATESLECGRARFARGELDEASRAFEAAVRMASDPAILADARYWYAETLYALGNLERADFLFREGAADRRQPEYALWALYGSGWTALRLGDFERARAAFAELLGMPQPVPLDSWGRHGHGLALYALGRHDEAQRAWNDLIVRRVPAPLERDVLFWQGEALGRLGEYDHATRLLKRFTEGGRHPLLTYGLVRLGWWSLRGNFVNEAVAALRAALAQLPGAITGGADAMEAREREWAEAGLALALTRSSDWARAQSSVQALDFRQSALGVPVRLELAEAAARGGAWSVADTTAQELLGASLPPHVRAWVLLLRGEAALVAGNRDEARTQFELARGVDAVSDTGVLATLRLAQVNFELRAFAQAQADLWKVIGIPATPAVRAAALILQGEAAYRAGDYASAMTAYGRVLAEHPSHPQAPMIRAALAWTELRRGQTGEARRQLLDLVRDLPSHPYAPDALLLASELALEVGDLEAGRELLDRLLHSYGGHPRADFARLNRAILRARAGEAAVAEREIGEWISRAPFGPLVGRALTARGAALLAAGRPADARPQFEAAQRQGFENVARLGLGVVALAEGRWDDAERLLTEARDTGTPAVAAAAKYGLAVVAFHRGKTKEFKQLALQVLDAEPRGPLAPGLLYILTASGAEEQDWIGALAMADRLAADFPMDEAADDAFERIGAAAAAAGAWPVAYDAYTRLRLHFPQSPFVDDSRFTLAQAQLETGRLEEARRGLEEFLARAPRDPRAPKAWLALGRARTAAGDKKGALEAFERAARAGDDAEWTNDMRFSHARALIDDKRWADARVVLERLLQRGDEAVAREAAVAIGDTHASEGRHLAAVEYYMTAAYLAPESPAGRRGLLAAGRAFAALRDKEAATAVLKKLLAQSAVPEELVAEARRTLAGLER